MSREQTIAQFYEDPNGLALPMYKAVLNGLVMTETPALHHNDIIDPSAVQEKLDEAGRALRLIEHNGSNFEIATANNHASDEDAMLHISTFSSSITGNMGNAYEFATQAVRYPNRRQIYVASFGNGGTGRLLTHKERRYAAKTGRFTWEKDDRTVPLPSIKNLHGALGKAGLSVSIIGGDSAGGSYGIALSAAMEEGRLTHAFFSEHANFVNLSIPLIIRNMFYRENIINDRQNRELSPDPEKMTDEKMHRAAETYALYKDTPKRQELTNNIVRKDIQVRNMLISMQALRRGPRGKRNPIVKDTNAMLRRHPDAKITFGLAELDQLYKNPERAHRAAQVFLGSIAVQHAPVRAVMIPQMTHAYNKYFPSLYNAVKRYALSV